jgi:predicted TIM-barrel fold metal-dependent hydrolase
LYLDENFREGFVALVALNLTFDDWVFQTQLGDVSDVARAFPQARIVLNHVYSADEKTALFSGTAKKAYRLDLCLWSR